MNSNASLSVFFLNKKTTHSFPVYGRCTNCLRKLYKLPINFVDHTCIFTPSETENIIDTTNQIRFSIFISDMKHRKIRPSYM